MKLTYRGVTYQPKTPVVVTVPGKVIGRYRGIELHEQVTSKH